ncbi:gamma-glutamyltransferase [Campylobacter hepaticus]|uniref:Glutathione hydrolase proenzyme n=1 Tax=Campylobacter hepaticus TaxID=1813019 RepID=A0A6A7JTT6_9BACT|nr:gamma-glutamyltransferase [Campylobacter hepaticus]AXP09203.1 gamma-glutamyltransferase [Campylobacter hepaticus]MCZ0771707.1 gamma-glutamyltransferase [Campylobacter hepaticus]MCZ0773176.1 gamma-glutamyltransferase [Campylobacter hepaticus]MCZ0775855.1 gamma-glutamyltransferase [Campylobacter hepaticus]MDX2323372.1 gamma-glutamyltransferase [Campylobacter hepaticus]
MRYLIMLIISFTLGFGAANAPIKDKSGTGLVLSSHELANKIGKSVLDKGGNAIDAAVAVGYALAVVHPSAGNIGGGGFAVIHLANGENTTLDFREMAPLKASKDMYLDSKGEVIKDASTIGYLAAGVPGTVKGMSAMLERYGTMKLSDLIEPAIKLAEKGYLINDRQEQTMLEVKDIFKQFSTSSKYFLKKDGSTYKSGDLFIQKDLAKTLKLIAKEGPDAFYKGKIADLIVADMVKNKGIISKEDLASYQAIWRKPIKGSYRGYDIISMSPPSSGGAHIVQILNIMENADIENLGFGSSKTLHIMAEAMRQVYADRSEYLGDPDFVNIPLDKLTSKEYAKKIYTNIPKDKAIPSSQVKPGLGQIHEGTNTTHYSVLDSKGNAVSITYTINASYGSGAAVEGAGFLLNDEMDDFSIKPGVPNLYGLVGGQANAIEPKKRPLSSMSPTIILKDGKVFMVVGSPGGSRIITTVLQVISNVIDHKMDISTAVESPRFHMQWLPDEIRTEPFGIIKDVQIKLEKMGYKITQKPYMGDVNAIMVDPKTGKILGSMDTRKEF